MGAQAREKMITAKKGIEEVAIRKLQQIWNNQILSKIENYIKTQLGENAQLTCTLYTPEVLDSICLRFENTVSDCAFLYYFRIPAEIVITSPSSSPHLRRIHASFAIECRIVYDSRYKPHWRVHEIFRIINTTVHALNKAVHYYNFSLLREGRAGTEKIDLEKIERHLNTDELMKWIEVILYVHSDNMTGAIQMLDDMLVALQRKLRQVAIETTEEEKRISAQVELSVDNNISVTYEIEDTELNAEFSVSPQLVVNATVYSEQMQEKRKEQITIATALTLSLTYDTELEEGAVEISLFLSNKHRQTGEYVGREVVITRFPFTSGSTEINLPSPNSVLNNETMDNIKDAIEDILVTVV